jgi:hypothetical protein
MGAPSSAVLPEIYLQLLEHTDFIKILIQNNILGYFRCVHDILIAYKKEITDIYIVYRAFNSLVPTVKFNMETENDNKISFLYITIQRNR